VVSAANDHVEAMSVFDPDCLSRRVLEHATGRWGSLVLAALVDGSLRFGEVRRAVGGISDRMLAQTLQRLEADGLVIRTESPGIPARVTYELSDIGAPIARSICDLIDTVYQQLPAIVVHANR
jgi:DNA-binding HxlR family transcriptional regulator